VCVCVCVYAFKQCLCVCVCLYHCILCVHAFKQCVCVCVYAFKKCLKAHLPGAFHLNLLYRFRISWVHSIGDKYLEQSNLFVENILPINHVKGSFYTHMQCLKRGGPGGEPRWLRAILDFVSLSLTMSLSLKMVIWLKCLNCWSIETHYFMCRIPSSLHLLPSHAFYVRGKRLILEALLSFLRHVLNHTWLMWRLKVMS